MVFNNGSYGKQYFKCQAEFIEAYLKLGLKVFDNKKHDLHFDILNVTRLLKMPVNKYRIPFLLAITFLSFGPIGFAQDFKIKRLEQVGEVINLYYDLLDSTANSTRTYSIFLYSSLDSYTIPLAKVSGDIGQIVKPGGNRKISWSAKEELGSDFEGKVGFEVRGSEFIPFLKLDGFRGKKSRKRGVKEDVTWSGGRANSLINFELYRNGKYVAAPYTSIATSLGKYSIAIPKTTKPGSGYTFKIRDSKDKEQYIFTEEFAVRRKVPLGLKVIPIVGVGALVYFLTQGNANNDIPNPLDIGVATGKN
jgi:hypothetical protein